MVAVDFPPGWVRRPCAHRVGDGLDRTFERAAAFDKDIKAQADGAGRDCGR
jgi:hypothetical protein